MFRCAPPWKSTPSEKQSKLPQRRSMAPYKHTILQDDPDSNLWIGSSTLQDPEIGQFQFPVPEKPIRLRAIKSLQSRFQAAWTFGMKGALDGFGASGGIL